MTDRPSANESNFEPLELSCPEFLSWATRIGLRLSNCPPGLPDAALQRIIVSYGTPSPAWAQALVFMLTLAQVNKRDAHEHSI